MTYKAEPLHDKVDIIRSLHAEGTGDEQAVYLPDMERAIRYQQELLTTRLVSSLKSFGLTNHRINAVLQTVKETKNEAYPDIVEPREKNK